MAIDKAIVTIDRSNRVDIQKGMRSLWIFRYELVWSHMTRAVYIRQSVLYRLVSNSVRYSR